MTAAVQADLEREGFPGHVATEDKGLQFGPSFQRHSEPSTPTQYGALRTVRTQGLFSYREDYRAPVDTESLPPPEPWLEPAVDAGDSGRMSPCGRDGSWFLRLLHTETQRMEGWCKEMEREAEDNDLAEESKGPAGRGSGEARPGGGVQSHRRPSRPRRATGRGRKDGRGPEGLAPLGNDAAGGAGSVQLRPSSEVAVPPLGSGSLWPGWPHVF